MQYLGKATVKVDGKTLRSKDGAAMDIGGPQRTTQKDASGFGYTEEPMPGKLDCELNLAKGDTLADIRNWDNVTVTLECDTGQIYVGQGWWCLNPPKVTSGQGGAVALSFEGPPAQEVA